ncbi:MAG TPA: hypothetical protein VLD19_00950 [Chitinophagaceae bacterium]|nr:hypothetical protein [Chitinophagaceae bacterium]
MTASIENIVQHLFHQPSLQSVSVNELQQMTQDYPSFAAARFLLLKKMQDTGHPDFNTQLYKTSVYFNNPLWLQLLLSPHDESSAAWRPSGTAVTEIIEHDTEPPSEEAPASMEEAPPVITGEPEQPEEPAAVEPVEIQSAGESIAQEIQDRLREQIRDAQPESHQQGTTEAPAPEAPAEEEETTYAKEPLLIQEVLDRLRGQIQEADIHETPQEEAPVSEEMPVSIVGDLTSAGEELMASPLHTDQEAPVIAEPEPQVPAEIATQDDQPKEEDFAPFPDAEPIPVVEMAQSAIPGPQAPDTAFQDPDATEPAPFKIIIETPMAQHDMLFEPYHTIDYFASQGIRLDKIDPTPQDKLGRQLKSFTEWLKSMKKLPQVSIEKVLGENEESAVVAAASHSIEGKEVITEAMAEVYEKQGMHDKAAGIYRKLSLLNPAKSAYFADRINALKQ